MKPTAVSADALFEAQGIAAEGVDLNGRLVEICQDKG